MLSPTSSHRICKAAWAAPALVARASKSVGSAARSLLRMRDIRRLRAAMSRAGVSGPGRRRPSRVLEAEEAVHPPAAILPPEQEGDSRAPAMGPCARRSRWPCRHRGGDLDRLVLRVGPHACLRGADHRAVVRTAPGSAPGARRAHRHRVVLRRDRCRRIRLPAQPALAAVPGGRGVAARRYPGTPGDHALGGGWADVGTRPVVSRFRFPQGDVRLSPRPPRGGGGISSTAMIQRHLLQTAAALAADYLDGLATRAVAPTQAALEGLRALERPLPDGPTDPTTVLAELHAVASPATIASAGGRFFGFVVGGSLPVALAASWLATAWDQDAGLAVLGPGAAALEEVALRWLLEALRLPAGSAGGFVTGATMANFTALAAARHALLKRAGWDVEAQGLFGAPALTVVVGEEVHVSLLKALGLLGLGRDRVVRVPTDAQGRIRADLLPSLDERTIVCLQAGNVNTGASDPVGAITRVAQRARAWVHVDGAFGLWAAAAPARAPLVAGVEEAESWALDAHKWLNVPYDSGIALCRDPAALQGAMATAA